MDTSRRITVAATALAATAVLIAVYALGQSGAHATSATVTPAPSPTSGPSSAAPAISVAGLGKVSGTPDILSLSLGVEVRAANVSAAMDSASKSMRDVLAALKSSGVADPDLQTAGVSVQGNYRYDNDGTSHINGYVATQQLTAKLRSVSKAGAVIAAAVAAGGDAIRLNGLSLSLDNDSALLSQARERAFAEARSKAEQYAKLAGVSLGTVISINESVLAGNQPYYGKSAMDFAASAPMPTMAAQIQVGSQDVAVTVAVVYAIG